MSITLEKCKTIAEVLPGNVVIYSVKKGEEPVAVYYADIMPETLGYTKEEFNKITDGDSMALVIEEDRKIINDKINEDILNDTNIDLVFRMRHKEKGFIWVHMVAGKVGEEGDKSLFIATDIDVTHEMLNSYGIMEASDRAICVIAKDNKRLLYANDNFYGIINMKPSESMGVYCYNALCGNPAFKSDNNCLCFSTIGLTTPFEYYNPVSKKHFSMYGREIKWGEHDSYVFFLNDRTEEKFKELQLKNAQERFNATLNNSGLFIWEYDIINHRCINSEKAVRDYGLPLVIEDYPESLYSMGHTPPETVAQIKEAQRRLESGEDGFTMERKTIDKNGKAQWMRIEYSLQKGENGIPLRALACGTDITEQKELEEKYEEQIAYRNSLAVNALLSMRADLDAGTISDYTCTEPELKAVLERHLNIEETMFALCTRVSFLQNQEREGKTCFDTALLRQSYGYGNNQHYTEYYCRSLDKTMSLSVTLSKNPSTEHVEGFYIFSDITQAHTTKVALQAVINQDYDFVSIIDAKNGDMTNISGRIINSRIAGNVGKFDKFVETFLTAGEKGFTTHEEFETLKDELSIENIKKHLETTTVYELNMSLKYENPYLETYRLRFSYLNEYKNVMVMTRSNITTALHEEKSVQQKLANALDEAQKANNAKTEFLSTVSHDMRTPMNGILGLARLAKDKTDLTEIRDDIDQILLSGQYLLRLINDTLDMNRIESGKLKLQEKPIHSEDVFRNVMMQAAMLAKDKGVELLVHQPSAKHGQWIPVMSDEARLEQIFMNIISNAIKYTPSGGTVELEIDNLSSDNEIVLDRYIIRDNGIGMSQEFLPHIFEPFKQEGRINTERQNGTGLGMSIVKQLVTMMGGTITINSVINEGTEVIIEIPYKVSREDIEAEKAYEIDMDMLKGKKILLCEDHPLNRKIAVALIEKGGMTAITAENGKEGVEMFEAAEAGSIAAILMDIRMPVMDGITASKSIRACGKKDAKTVPIIALTANAFDDDIKMCHDAGMNAHLTKPYTPEQLYLELTKCFKS